jgi:molecular chaperone GrpE
VNVEAVLAEFRTWLQENLASGGREPPAEAMCRELTPPARPEAPDLHTLLGQFTALRHEVNLQTKAARAQQEQNTETLRQLSAAVEALQEVPDADTDEVLRPILKAMLDAADALALAQREVRRVQKKLLPALDEMASAAQTDIEPVPEPDRPMATAAPLSLLARWLGLDETLRDERDRLAAWKTELRARHVSQLRELKHELTRAGKAAEMVRRSLESVLTGYGMSLQRLERMLQQQGLEAIPAVGERFDPERMEVIEVVTDSGKPAGEVIEEVRRGYLWRGSVFRFAQVKVAK